MGRPDGRAHLLMFWRDLGGLEGFRFQALIEDGMVHRNVAEGNAMLARVAHDLGRGVKAHGLGVEEGAGEDVRIMALQPAGGIDEESEGRGMAFGKAIFAETLDLLEAALGEVALIASLDHALDHLLLEGVDGADPPEGRHRPAQAVGLARREAGRHDGDPHRLFLKERHAEGPAQHLCQFRLGIGDLFEPHLPPEIGMDHVALDGAGAHDRHFDDEVVEAVGAQFGQHGHLRPAFDLEDAERIGPLDHLVGRRIILGFGKLG